MKITANGVTIPNPEKGVAVMITLDGDETIQGACSITTKGGCLTIQGSKDQAAFTLILDPGVASKRYALKLLGGGEVRGSYDLEGDT